MIVVDVNYGSTIVFDAYPEASLQIFLGININP